MGLHTGLGIVSSGSYVGNDVNRAAGSRPRQTAARSSCRRPRSPWWPTRCRPACAPATSGSTASRTFRPEHWRSSRSTICPPIPPDPLARQPAEQPADRGHLVRRKGDRAGRDDRPARVDPPPDPDRNRAGPARFRLFLELAAVAVEAFLMGSTSWPSSRSAPALVAPTIVGILGVAEDSATRSERGCNSWIAARRLLLVLDDSSR